MAAGPLLGVAVIVGSIGVLQSTTGELRDALRRLGTNLLIATVAEGRLPFEAAERAARVPTVDAVAALGSVGGTIVSAAPPTGQLAVPPANQVLTADPELGGVLEIGLAWGRSLHDFDEEARTTAAVIGDGVAERLWLERPDVRTLYIGGHPFAIVGVLQRSPLYPEVNSAVLIPTTTAQQLFGANPRPATLLVKVEDGTERRTAGVLGDAVTYGAALNLRVSVPSDLLAAQTEIDRTLAGAVVGLGLLAMVVGGFGIANVMLISVMERRREIGVRRALGHTRGVIALQFLTESGLVGLIGAGLGGALAAGFVVAVAAARGWTVVLDPLVVAGAVAAAVLVSLLAGMYPAARAARLQPLDALRDE
ncbi:MAG TPA: ABC transporter permease [Actinomycetota bacterium]|nr:ABC transporter permease [Actinomycetota bacterium]